MVVKNLHLRTQTLGRVLYRNFLRETGIVAYDGTETAGFDAMNAYDWRDFSLFAPEAGATTNLEIDLSGQIAIDTIVVWRAQDTGTITSVKLQAETAPAVWTTIYSMASPATGMTIARIPQFNSTTGQKLRFQFESVVGEVLFRQLCAGPALTFETGQHSGVQPPNLLHGVVMDNVISVNGSIIGRSVRRLERKAMIDLSHLSPEWVRSEWASFADHMRTKACFYQWAPVLYPSEVVFAAAEEIVAPENQMPPPLMKVSMPLKCIV